MKKIFLVMLLSFFLFPVTVLAAAPMPIKPEFNPICWKEEECIKIRKTYGASDADAKDGFLKMESPCNQEGYGKCLPAGVANTAIKFGGQTKFADIGQFLITNYNYVLSVAGILAAIMIIVAGAQWVTSGGSSEAIGSAKKRIAGALVGLLIAYLSYAILNTINPALVNLRLPQTFVIRPTALSFSYCSQSPSSTQFADAGSTDKVLKPDDFTKITEFPLTIANREKLLCGNQYYVGGSNGATCLGSFCPSSGGAQLCAPDFSQPDKRVYTCRKGIAGGKVTFNSVAKEFYPLEGILTEEWDYPAINDGETELWVACEDGDTTDVGNGDYGETIDDKNQYYLIDGTIAELEKGAKDCESRGGLKGFVLMFEMNENWDMTDEPHIVGWDGGVAKDLGDQDFFEKNFKKINKKYFIPLDAFKGPTGFMLDVEAASIFDMDEDADYSVYNGLLK